MQNKIFYFVASLIFIAMIMQLYSNNERQSNLLRETEQSYKEEISELEAEILILKNQKDSLIAENKEYEETLYGYGGRGSYPEEIQVEDNFVFPVAEDDFIRFTSPFGLREDPFLEIKMQHEGIDIATVWKAQVVSVREGIVIEHYPPPGGRFTGHHTYGGMLKVDHGDFKTLYAHLSETYVNSGDEVETGEVIGRVGDSGRSRGQHLHFEMIVEDEYVNPLLYIGEIDYNF